ncbi:MAG: Na+/H+ antiporter subunit A, partial [Anaerolineae bacterium]|nr:Na+/H+ antiporter subunit A [Anaerolineae bacterium]
MTFALIVAASFISALFIGVFGARLRATLQGWLLALVMGILFALALGQLPAVGDQGMTVFSIPWVPSLGLNLTLYADGLALLFVLLVTS